MCQHEKLEIASMMLGTFGSGIDCDQPESVKCPQCPKYKSGECDPMGFNDPPIEPDEPDELEYTLVFD